MTLIKSKQRVRDHGEVFTPAVVYLPMINLTEPVVSQPQSTVLEPSCGTGNFLIEILKRKLNNCKSERDAVVSIASLYGIEILDDNVQETKDRLINTLSESKFSFNKKSLKVIKKILDKNIIHGDALKQVYQLSYEPIIIYEWTVDSTFIYGIGYYYTDLIESDNQIPVGKQLMYKWR